MPGWLTTLSYVSLTVAVLCALWIAIDILRGHRQPMAIMHVVWPVTALYAGPLGLWAYWRWGRPRATSAGGGHASGKSSGDDAGDGGSKHAQKSTTGGGSSGKSSSAKSSSDKSSSDKSSGKQQLSVQSVALAATHCGSGCTLGDLCAESLLILFPFTWFGSELLTGWTLDYMAAFVIGIAFQYFTIKPMTDQAPGQALVSSLKADSLSLTAWQVGMYGWMAIATFVLFDHRLEKTGPVFWFMMQIAMLCGFLTACPVNAWLIRRGIKEKM